MANKPLQSIKFPGLPDTYTVPQVDNTLTQTGAAADAKKTGDEISDLKSDLAEMDSDLYPEITENLSTQHLATLTEHNGYYINTNKAVGTVIDYTPVSASNGTGWAIYTCNKGDKYSLTAKGGNNSRIWCFVDTEDKVLTVSGQNINTGDTPVTVIAPADGKLICNVTSLSSPLPTLVKKYNGNTIDSLDTRVSALETKSLLYDDLVTDAGIASPYYHGAYDICKADITNDWYEGYSESYNFSDDGFGENTLYSHVIDKFDALMAMDTDYITKTSLGTGSGLDANDDPYTLYEYVFKPKRYAETLNAKKVPKILLQCCQHGFEKGVIYGAYYFLYDLVNNCDKNTRLDFIRKHVEIHLIPVVNPWGFDNNSYYNANDVNLNRNYPVPNWAYVPTGSSDSSGEEPFDQPETIIVKDWVEDNLDAILFIDGHTNGKYYSSGYNNMNPLMPLNDISDAYYNKCFRAFVRHIEDQTFMLPTLYQAIEPDAGNTATSFCGRIQAEPSTSTRGTANIWTSIYKKLVGFTFECINGLAVSGENVILYMSPEAKKIDSEMIGNVIAELLREYA